jgi:hypothetical protein
MEEGVATAVDKHATDFGTDGKPVTAAAARRVLWDDCLGLLATAVLPVLERHMAGMVTSGREGVWEHLRTPALARYLWVLRQGLEAPEKATDAIGSHEKAGEAVAVAVAAGATVGAAAGAVDAYGVPVTARSRGSEEPDSVTAATTSPRGHHRLLRLLSQVHASLTIQPLLFLSLLSLSILEPSTHPAPV